jgi:hypothetical protein
VGREDFVRTFLENYKKEKKISVLLAFIIWMKLKDCVVLF